MIQQGPAPPLIEASTPHTLCTPVHTRTQQQHVHPPQVGQLLSHPFLQQLLSSGVYTLLDVCGENDMVFLKASLDPSYRDLFSTLLTNYSKHHKFTGQV